MLFDPNVLISLDRVTEFVRIQDTASRTSINSYDPTSLTATACNTESGFRDINTNTGAKNSPHKKGRAFDLHIERHRVLAAKGAGNPHEGLRNYMDEIGCFKQGFKDRQNDPVAFPFLLINRIEWIPNMTWFHFDTYPAHDATCIEIVGGNDKHGVKYAAHRPTNV